MGYGSDVTYMQDFATLSPEEGSAIVGSMADGETISLKDSRDEKTYYISKLADGNLWMLDNLALDISDSTIRDKMTTDNTNTTSAGLTKLESTINGTDSSTWTDSYTDSYINTSNKDVLVTSYGTAAVDGQAKVGIYYNYCAASGGTICVSSYGNNATYDVCPAGWHLPTGASGGQFQALYSVYSGNADNFRSALSTPLSGYFSSGSTSNQGSSGGFWSSTRYNNTTMFLLNVNSSNANPQGYSGRLVGYSVRCVRSS